ncbi:hypothetical protein MCELANE86_00467 [Candidatus Nanopelagicaceae bacterium]
MKVQKVMFWSIEKSFEAKNLEEAIALAKADQGQDWQEIGYESVSYSLVTDNG